MKMSETLGRCLTSGQSAALPREQPIVVGWREAVIVGVGSRCYSSTQQFKYKGRIIAIERGGGSCVSIHAFVGLGVRLRETSAVEGPKEDRSTSALGILPPHLICRLRKSK